jgi:hypothetical protein
MAVTDTPGITPPDSSTTVPCTVAFCCAAAVDDSSKAHTISQPMKRDIQQFLLPAT